MKIVLDTNILLVVISRKTKYHAIWQAFLAGRFEICVTTDILNEYAEKLEEKFHPRVAVNVLKALENSPDVCYIKKYYHWKAIVADPDDDKFVDCAVAANADFIVTNDKHFNGLKNLLFPKVAVLDDEAFLEMMATEI